MKNNKTLYKLLLVKALLLLVLFTQAQTNKPTTDNKVGAVSTSKVYTPGAYPGGTVTNSVNTWMPQQPYTLETDVTSSSRQVSEVMRNMQYVDGLGRQLQTVAWRVSPSQKDVVAPVAYDSFGRQQHQFLPYASTGNDGSFKTDPFNDQKTFYTSTYPSEQPALQGEQLFYGKSVFEASPLNRVIKTLAPGNSWAGSENETYEKAIKIDYLSNNSNDNVRIWRIEYNNLTYGSDNVSVNIPSTSAAYAAGTLFKMVMKDERGNATVEYKDASGKVILKKVQSGTVASDYSGYTNWLCTYYVYDDLGMLRFVISPKAVKALVDVSTWDLTINSGALINELCFRYEYDERGRMIAKKVPGTTAWTYMVYDIRDRLVYTQDGNMKAKNQWMTIIYDALNRAVQSGIIMYTTADTWTSLITLLATAAPGSPLPSGVTLTALTQNFYDDYSWTSKTYSTANNSNLDIGDNPYGDALPSAASQRTRGMLTGTKVRVINNPDSLAYGSWLETATFYDDKGREMQVNTSNYKGGIDVKTTRYNFAGKPISTYYTHNNPAGSVSNLTVKSNMNYDHAGRLLNVKKKVNNEAVHTIATYTYDAMGQVKNKKVGQQKDGSGALTSTPMENQDYAYTIRGWLKGINWNNYGGSGKTAAQTGHWFAMDLSYDWGYDNNQYNGNIAGIRWQSGSDKEERAYGFGYDAVNRLLFADFNQYTSGAFNRNAGIDFTVKMGDGINPSSAYDENGNILQMQHWGLKGTSSTQIDDLRYGYYDYSNKLKNVRDQTNDANTTLGDFRTSANHPDGSNNATSRIDYDYDLNGNLKKDFNKDIGDASVDGIIYNHLNLPWKVTVKNKGTIVYVYDASGNKLEKRIDEPASAGNNYQARAINTAYLGGFVYENNVLQFFAHEEGRIRDKKDVNGSHMEYAYDYFLKDHLGNIRMTLTDEIRKDKYPAATMEDALAASEETLYSNLPATRAGVPPGYPTDNSFSNPNNKVAKVGGPGSSSKIGPAIVLKVMAGDSVNFQVRSWYNLGSASPTPTSSILTDLVSALSGSIGGVAGSKATSGQLSSSGLMSTAATDFLNGQSFNNTKAKAYVSWIFFDEQFKVVSSGAEQVGADQAFPLHVQNLLVSKNGYAYIFTSNESQNVNVYFDNLAVSHVRGPLVEENHYYAFGLTMAGISSKAVGVMGNNLKFNSGTELNTEFNWNMYETPFRNYDAQVGRFWQVDPLAAVSYEFSPYVFSNDNPLILNDPTGLLSDSAHPQELDPVYVTPHSYDYYNGIAVRGGFPWPYYTAQDARIAEQSEYVYSTRVNNKLPVIQPGDSKYYIQHIPDWQRFYQANQDYRRMSLGAVAVIAAPIVAAGIIETGAGAAVIQGAKWTFKLKLGANLGAAAADLTTQAITKDARSINLTSVVANGLIGGNLFGSSLVNSTLGSSFNISINSLSGNTNILTFDANAIIFNTIGNVSGGFLGKSFGSEFGSFEANLYGNTFGNGLGIALDPNTYKR